MTVKEIIDKLSEYNLEAEINIVVDGKDRIKEDNRKEM